MKIWVPKQNEVAVEVIAQDNSDSELRAGDLAVTMDGRTRIWSPDEFAERFEAVERHSWPGYLKRKMGQSYSPGTLAVGFEGANMRELVSAMNAWAAESSNRHLILGDNGDHYWTGADGRCYALLYVYSETTPEDATHLAEKSELEAKVKAEWEEKKKQLGIDERNHLEKAQDARQAQEAANRIRQRELEADAAAGKHCKANHGKLGKGKTK